MAKRLSVFAGTGDLVPHAVEAALKAGYKVQVLALTPRTDLAGVKVINADLSNPLGLIWSLKIFRTSHVVLAGGITLTDGQREGLAKFANNNSDRPSGVPSQALGDAALTGLATVLKKMTGADLVGVHEIAPDLLADKGLLAGPALTDEQSRSAAFALRMAREIGRLDIGQAVVVVGEHVISAEDLSGTDGLLARVGGYHANGLAGGGHAPLVLAKAVKPQQPLFADLPAIGPDTVTNAKAAGVSIVAVEAGKSIVIERERLIAAAERENISVVGMTIDG